MTSSMLSVGAVQLTKRLINQGIGAYRDDNAKPWILPVVKKVSEHESIALMHVWHLQPHSRLHSGVPSISPATPDPDHPRFPPQRDHQATLLTSLFSTASRPTRSFEMIPT